MLEAYLQKLIINEKSDQHILILKEKAGKRILPVIISIFEAISIDRVLRKTFVPRPLTHDLFNTVIKALSAELEFVEISRLFNGTFFGNLHFKNSFGVSVAIDCRPSDAIALAVRAKCPIMVQDAIFEQAGEIDSSEN